MPSAAEAAAGSPILAFSELSTWLGVMVMVRVRVRERVRVRVSLE